MSPSYTSLVRHLDSNEVNYQGDPEHGRVKSYWGSQFMSYEFVHQVEDEQLLQVFAIPGFKVPPGARPTVAEAVCRANYGLKIGKFEFDPSDGELRFQAAMALNEKGEVTEKNYNLAMAAVFFSLDRYVPAFLAIIYGNEPTADAINAVER